MNAKRPVFIIALLAAVGLLAQVGTGCRRHEAAAPVKIVRLDSVVAAWPAMDANARTAMADSMADGLEALFFVMDTPLTDSTLAKYSRSRAVAVFSPDVARLLPSLDGAERQLGELREALAAELPGLAFPTIYGVVSPYRKWIFQVDGVMLIGLNHYLGPDYAGYEGFEEYVRSGKRIENLAPDVAEALLAGEKPFETNATGAPTLLARMLYDGALAYAKTQLLPSVSARQALGYDDGQWKWLGDNESRIWDKMIKEGYLYSVDPMIGDRLLLPSPRSTLINPECPGRAGRYIGWRIVEAFVKNNPGEASLSFLLSPEFYGSETTLQESQYAPR